MFSWPSYEDLFDRFNTFPFIWKSTEIPTDLYDSPEESKIVMDVPGVKKEDIDIQQNGDSLIVTLKREEGKETNDQTPFLQERWQGKKVRKFTVRDVDANNITATLKDGVLTITISKKDRLKKVNIVEA